MPVRIYEIAKSLGVQSKDVLAKAKELNISNAKVASSSLDKITAEYLEEQLAKELNIGVIFISQVNDDGRTKYAASLEEEAIICIKIDRDVETDDEVLQNTTNFLLDKNRPFARLGHAGSVYYDPDTTILTEG